MSDTSSTTSSDSSASIKDARTPSREIAYMNKLKATLMEKRGVAATTATMSVAQLRAINGGKGFTSLAFLTDVDTVRAAVEKDHAVTTQQGYYGRIIAALSTTTSNRYKKPLEAYKKLFEGSTKEYAVEVKERGTDLTKKEAAVWMDWPAITAHYEKVEAEANTILSKGGDLTAADYDKVQDHLLLSLFTRMTPRRNKDYSLMWVTRKAAGDDKSKNYYVLNEGKMYFNNYKTAKTHGQQVVDVPKEMRVILLRFLKLTGVYRRSRGRAPLMPLICNCDGTHYDNPTKMTLLLNRAFGKKISCNILRHAYISNLYTPAVAAMETTAAGMGHSVVTHLHYFRQAGAGADTIEHAGSD